MQDPDGILARQGTNARYPDMIRVTSDQEPQERKSVIARYLEEAKAYAQAGIVDSKDESALEPPKELVDVLNTDSGLAEAFYALTRGRQKSYVINLNGAKTAQTRLNRIAKF